MAQASPRKSGRTLGWATKGLADLRRAGLGYTLRRAALAGVAIGAFVAGIAASSAALEGDADAGVVAIPGEPIDSVSPTGFAWRDGIRPGQVVVAVTPADDPGGWRLETLDGDRRVTSEEARAEVGLRDSLPIGLAALAAGGLALLFVRTRRQWVLPISSIAYATASTPLGLEGSPIPATLILGAAAIVPAAWLIGRLPGGRWKDASVGFIAFAGLAWWLMARLGGSSSYEAAESIRGAVAVWGSIALTIDRTVVARLAGEEIHLIRPNLVDVAAIALLAGASLALMNLANVPPVVVAALVVVAVAARPLVRNRFRPIEDALLADVRAQAQAQAVEAERARLARELHDVPLQELIGVIRRLEVMPGTEAESDDLRALASHLRNVAIDLRPPVLDDLGLTAALEYLADQTTSASQPVVAVINTGVSVQRASRPPADVELAMFRIATEAVTNAIRHSGASAIEIAAEVSPSRIELIVSDNGSGFDASTAARSRARHIGLSSMRRRAQAIDCDLSITAAQPGTRVRALWQA
jgi:signal transduction histidine kinase